ncbi:MAG: arginine--tRNA ligase [Patescibacteria group bacterium]|nr:arginine--tRNA ligase [Patescibacteria group bacterium]MCL5432298.1 arginine--tRNA ligase [Patescibacteria group bacterium]
MMIADDIRQAVLKAVKTAFPEINLKPEDIELEHPTAQEHRDYSTNIALKLKTGHPREVAQKIVVQLQETTSLEASVAGPGFINFTLSPAALMEAAQKIEIAPIGKGKTVVIDYAAPNIARRFGVGHLRSTIIGQALYNIYQSLGYKVIGDNHLGDWGTQFGKLLYMINEKAKGDFTIDDLEKWYVEFHRQSTPQMEAAARFWFKRLEDGDKKARNLWKKCVDVSMEEFNRIFDLLGVKIDFAYGESFYEDKMPAVIMDAQKISKLSDGARVVEIPGIKIPLMLVKSDGATTYATRDLATLKFRKEQWNPDIMIYEVGVDQELHFRQVFAVARQLGYVKQGAILCHTRHGMYRWPSGRFRTREGNTPKLEGILQEAIARAAKLGSQEAAQAVGIGAIKYFDLKHGVQSDIVFDWEKMFELQGDSGPYLQYTFARAQSVLRKSKGKNQKAKITGELTNEELALLRYLYRFPEVVEAAARQYAPNLVCSYLFELAKRYNNFYNNCPILGNDLRLKLTATTADVLKNGLNLLGIEALERM